MRAPHYQPLSGYGFVLIEKEIPDFILKYAKVNHLYTDTPNNRYSSKLDFNAALKGICKEFNTYELNEWNADCITFQNPAFTGLLCHQMLPFRADKQPSPTEAAYASIDEVIEEFQTKLGKYLPDDFDKINYKFSIGFFSAAEKCDIDYVPLAKAEQKLLDDGDASEFLQHTMGSLFSHWP